MIRHFFNKPIKDLLKGVDLFYEINARIKARVVKKQYHKTVAYYALKKEPMPFEMLLSARLGDRIERLRRLNRPPNIFLLGTDEMQDRSGTIQALERLGCLTYFTQVDGKYGQDCSGSSEKRAKTNSIRLWDMVGQLHVKGEAPDIIIAQTWGNFMDGTVLSRIRDNFGTVIINIVMDDRHQYWGKRINGVWGGTYGLIPHIDLALTTAPECVEWYMKEGCPALFFPEASDPNFFHPMPNLPKIHDVCFVGGRYGIRKKIVEAIEASGVKVTAYGNGWPNGRIEIDDVPKLFSMSRIVLGVGTIGHCADFYSLKMRDFDGPMSGSLYLTHHNPDLENLFVIGKEIETYRTPKECADKVCYYLNHPDEVETIGYAGRLRAEKEHTWEKRFRRLFEHLTYCLEEQSGII